MAREILTIDDHLANDPMRALFKDEILALVVRNFTDTVSCIQLINFCKYRKSERYLHETRKADGTLEYKDYGISRIETPYNEIFDEPIGSEKFNRYYQDATQFRNELRKIFDGGLTPMDKLRLELDELDLGRIGITGAQLARFDGLAMASGIIRKTSPNCYMLEKVPHVDSLPAKKLQIKRQFSVMLGLKIPEYGGSTIIYDHEPYTQDEIEQGRHTRHNFGLYGYVEKVKLKIRQGDLIFFCTQQLHASEMHNEEKLTYNGFLAIPEQRGPIVVWS